MNCDLVVIGAGIQGAGVAQAASAAGYRVIVLEQYAQPAQGTSSRSSKLIHGGLRYLETGQFSLVKECLFERARLLQNAPHLVKLVPFYIPVYKNSHYSSLKIAAGLSFYSLISLKPFRRIPKKSWSSLDGLRQEDLTAVYQYYDAQTDDAKLTRAVLASAETMGAQTLFNSTFVTAEIEEKSCTVHYQHNGEDKALNCHAIVNAAGPWVKHIVDKIQPQHPQQPQPDIELIQGTHIELPGNLPQGVYYLEAPQDNRAVFVMPWQDHILIGTTETPYIGDPAKVEPLEAEVDYLLDVYNHYFAQNQSLALKKSDIINAFT
ncbi:MAG: FAD-dependent oxidoreductase, partial [Thiotrichaceae bacterium]